MERAGFQVVDYIVFALMLIISASIGVYYRFTGGKQKTTQEYLLGDRNLAVVPVGFSLMASFMSAITILGVSNENYSFGTQFVVINFAYVLATPIAAYCFLPVFFELQVTSVYEYLQMRFGLATRLLCSFAFSTQMILYMGIVLYAPALALSAVTSLSLVTAILSMGLVCTFYSAIGGMKAVVATDVFQSLLMYAAIFTVIVIAAIDVGGLSEIWRIADEGSRIEFFNIDPDPRVRHTIWSLVIGGMFTYLSLYAVNQAQVQRLMSLRNLRTSQKALWLSLPILMVLSLSTSFSGLAIYSKYYKCDPVADKRIKSSDQLMPLYVIETVGHIPGLAGLFVVGLFSGSLSTVSSALNSLSAVSLEDYIKPAYVAIKGRGLSENACTVLSKILALGYGMLCLAFAFLAQSFGGILQASLTIFGVIGGPLLGVFTLGMFFPFANQMGAVFGLLTSMMFALWLGFGGPKPPPPVLPLSTEGCNSSHYVPESNFSVLMDATNLPLKEEKEYFILYQLSYLWCVVIAFLICVVVGCTISFITGKRCGEWGSRKSNPSLFIPCVRRSLMREAASLNNVSSVYDVVLPVEPAPKIQVQGKVTDHHCNGLEKLSMESEKKNQITRL
ncbi:putative sodium-dependent multivitamin transporter [Ischnura elegans]|uniref:putative sodium-dependent multivitamin transporter n=1 Tax=Ischnura elegans TaxID=197161 RepID=UPI001ED866A5|nr:putative sodium-dependent multivitamin transporter [Ischnura elegans]XP_046396200.1 putative sodium-dependent multivitamin transporter [Ischnura elegans]